EVVLFENEVPLARGHQAHKSIREHGCGRYSHWNGQLYFSSSDNSDPRRNGRSYMVEAPRGLHGARMLGGPWTLGKILCIAMCLGGGLLLILPWSPLTAGDRAFGLTWLRHRTIPFLCLVVIVVLIALVLSRNALDVTALGAKAIHGGLCLL